MRCMARRRREANDRAMRGAYRRRAVLVILLAAFAVSGSVAWAADDAGRGSGPELAKIEATALRHFAGMGVQPGEIIAQNEVVELVKHFRGLGWNIPDKKGLIAASPRDTSFLVKVLRQSKKSRKFARQISKYPLGYDRLDRLSRAPQGRQTVVDLVNGPGGHELIEYMTTSSGGKHLGRQLAGGGQKDFNKPTGLVYTPEQVVEKLKTHFRRATAATEQNAAGRAAGGDGGAAR